MSGAPATALASCTGTLSRKFWAMTSAEEQSRDTYRTSAREQAWTPLSNGLAIESSSTGEEVNDVASTAA